MKSRGMAVLLVVLGLGLGATLLRDQVPVGDARVARQPSGPALVQAEAAGRLENERNTMQIVAKYEPGLVYINTEQDVTTQDPFAWMMEGGAQTQVQRGVGSGFFVNRAGDILTNYHVVAGDGGGASRITVRVMGSSKAVTAKVIGMAPQYDLALIRPSGLDAGLIRPMPLGNSDALKAGQKVIAMGAPFGLDFSVSEGIVSSVARQIPIGFGLGGQGITQKAIQTDAAINPGNSGGPLLDSAGNVIGINTQIYSPSGQSTGVGQSAGVGFAIPVNVARNLLPRLQAAKGGLVSAPQLGIKAGLLAQTGQGFIPVGVSALSAAARQEWRLPDAGIMVGAVTPGLPAARAGLRGGTREQQFRGGAVSLGGDVITAVNGKAVDGLEDLQAVLIDRKQGDSVTLKVWNAGKTRDVKVTLDAAAFR
ncbi:PDZ domain-containing protein [Deinococcus cavernae]|uniref:PDZ domain-containing protein n=1 Tax=Deinococcus cavernae TaxID=2320857 RepID=A0A418VBY2_9DEIO|nr:trypsin-like peptidase domain-containing protein [Deinococcus cavernae]RJF73654.1 PDZ domain-containing protein [Deinococcus cavernae]